MPLPIANGPPAASGRATVIATGPYVSATLPVFLVGALAVQLRGDLGFDEAALGVLIASARVATVIASAPGGWLVQRGGASSGLRTGAAATGVLLITGAVASSSWWTLLPFIALTGVATTVTESAADLWLTEHVRERRGLAFGIKQSAGPASGLLAGLAVPAFAITFGWRPTFVVGGLIALATATIVPRQRRHGSRSRMAVSRDGDVPASVLALLSIGFGLGGFAASALTGFFVSGAVTVGFADATAGMVFAIGAGLCIATRLALGHQADVRTNSLVMTVASLMMLGAIGFVLMAFTDGPAFLVGALLAFTAGWGWPGLFVLAIVRANPRAPAVGTAYVRTGGYVGTILGPLVVGAVATSSYSAAWSLAAGANMAAAVVLLCSRRYARRVLARPSPAA